MDELLNFWNALPETEQRRILIGIATAVTSAMVVGLLRLLINWAQKRIKRVATRKLATSSGSRFVSDFDSSTHPEEPSLEFGSRVFTFLFTDIEGSTRLWEQAHDAMHQEMARHDALMEQIAAQYAGQVKGERGEGDSRFIVFTNALNAVTAAAAIQESFWQTIWHTPEPVKIRIALHTGQAALRQNDLYGSDVNRCARIRALAHGGQILISQATHDLVQRSLPERFALRDLGLHRLRDLQRPERIYQLDIPGVPNNFPPLASLNALPNNLPIQVTSFIGREREIAKLKEQLNIACLITLTGAGGCGKTRLALQVAASIIENFRDGIWFIELAPISDPNLVPHIVASTLGVREVTSVPLNETLANYVSQRSMLLILDNCEHLVPACAQLATELLRICPRLKILATSRQVLGIAGETTFRVPSLALPDPQSATSLESLMHFESVRLFVDRAVAARSDWEITNPTAIAEICQQLDGIPLAIELAAPRVKVMTVKQIAARLNDRFRLLTGGSRTALPRQQTLRALIDWSYDLLSDSERLFLRRFSVFIGGASLEALETVCRRQPTEAYDLFQVLTFLVDKSLVLMEEQNGEARYRMLETIRQYAQEKLESASDATRVWDCHRDYFLGLVEEGELHLRGSEQLPWLNRLDMERDNILAALDWSQTKGDVDTCLRFGGALWWFWNMRGYWTDGRTRLANILALSGNSSPSSTRTKAMVGMAYLTLLQGDYPRADALLQECLANGKAVNAKREIAYTLYGLGTIAQYHGDYSKAAGLFSEGLELFRALEDRWGSASALLNLGVLRVYENNLAEAQSIFESSLGTLQEIGDKSSTAKVLGNLGLVAYYRKDYAAARPFYEQALTLCRELREESMIAGLSDNLGYVAFHQNDFSQAHAFFRESLALLYKMKSRRIIADVLYGFACLAAAERNPLRAARLFGAGEALYEALGAQVEVSNRAEYDSGVAVARSQIDQAAFDQACVEGRQMTLEQAIAYAME